MQYVATFELASRFVSVVKLQQKVARLAKSICEATSQKQERFSMFSPSPSFFLPLRTNLRQFIMWLYPIAKATGLEWSPACSISLVLTTSPPSFTFAHVLWQTKFMFFTRFAYALNKSLFSLLFSLVSFLFFYLCFTYFPLCLWLLYLLLFVDDFSFNLFPLFLIIFDNFEKSFFMRMIHNCHKDRDKVREMEEDWQSMRCFKLWP